MVVVDSPVKCKIFLKRKVDGSFELKELLLTQVFNYKISENKRPVYGFNKLDYGQVVRGKRLFEGVIVIKKSLVSDISKLVELGKATLKDEMNYTKNKVEYLKNLFVEDKSIKPHIEDYYKRALEDYKMKQRMFLSNQNADILNELPEDASLILAFGSYAETEDFKSKYNNMVNNTEFTYEEAEKLVETNNDFVIEDIQFFEKTGEVNISKNDIDEVYKFFGRLKEWSDM